MTTPAIIARNLSRRRKTANFHHMQVTQIDYREYTNFEDLSLPGFSPACDRKRHLGKRVLYGFLWSTALLCCIIQLKNLIVYYEGIPFTVNIKYTQENNAVIAPVVTICPKDAKYRNLAVSQKLLSEQCNVPYRNASDLLQNCNMTVQNLWNISRLEIEQFYYDMHAGDDWLEGLDRHNLDSYREHNVHKSELLTVCGTCITFKPNVSLPCMGTFPGINIFFSAESVPKEPGQNTAYVVVIHSEHQTPLVKYFANVKMGFDASLAQDTTVVLHVQEIVHIDTPDEPCNSEENFVKCLRQCIVGYILNTTKKSSCRLPYMDELRHLPRCRTNTEFLKMYKATQNAVKKATPASCNCTHACRKIHYKEGYITTTNPSAEFVNLLIKVPRCEVEVIQDEQSYDLTLLLSDIGGSVALFLGICILSLVELLDAVITRLCY